MALRTVTVKPSGGTYTSLAAAEAGERANLVTLDRQLEIECYSMLDTAAVTIGTGWTTDTTHYPRVFAPASERHDGKRNATKYRLETVNHFGSGLTIDREYVRVEGLQIKNTGTGTDACIRVQGNSSATTDIRISDCLLYDSGNQGLQANNGGDIHVSNTIAMGCVGRGFFTTPNAQPTLYLYNCAAVNCGGIGFGVGGFRVINCKNCYGANNTGGDFVADASGTLNKTTCHSADATGNTTTAFSTSTGGYFTNVTAGSEDLHIKASSALKDVGTDLSADAHWLHTWGNIDIEGQPRIAAAWDVGPDEYSLAAVNDPIFQTADGTILQAHIHWFRGGPWTQHASSGAGNYAFVNAGRVYSTINDVLYYLSAVPLSADYDFEADFRCMTLTSSTGITVRHDTVANTFYMFRFDASGVWELYERVAGTFTLLGSWADAGMVAGVTKRGRLKIRGTAIECYVDGTLRISVTNSSISAAGRAGVRLYGATTTTGIHLDNFLMTDVVAGGAFTDSATVTLGLVPSAAETTQYVETNTAKVTFTPATTQEGIERSDSATAILSLVPSAGDVASFVDASTASVALTPSGTDQYGATDSGQATLVLTPSGVDVSAYVDAATPVVQLTPSGADIAQYINASTTNILFTPSATEVFGGSNTDAATIALGLSPTSSDIAAYIDSNTIGLGLQPSAIEQRVSDDNATVSIQFTASGIENTQYVEADTVRLNYTVSGSEQSAYSESSVATLLYGVSSTEFASFTDATVAAVVLALSASDTSQFVDATVLTVGLTPSGTDLYLPPAGSSTGTVYLTLTPYGPDLYIGFVVQLRARIVRRWDSRIFNRMKAAING